MHNKYNCLPHQTIILILIVYATITDYLNSIIKYHMPMYIIVEHNVSIKHKLILIYNIISLNNLLKRICSSFQ
jgi:hypothetical protein